VTRRTIHQVEVEQLDGGVTIAAVVGYRDLPPIWLLRCDDGTWLTLERLRGVAPRPEDQGTADGWPSLPEILRHAEALP
jgi:hypothetical protein